MRPYEPPIVIKLATHCNRCKNCRPLFERTSITDQARTKMDKEIIQAIMIRSAGEEKCTSNVSLSLSDKGVTMLRQLRCIRWSVSHLCCGWWFHRVFVSFWLGMRFCFYHGFHLQFSFMRLMCISELKCKPSSVSKQFSVHALSCLWSFCSILRSFSTLKTSRVLPGVLAIFSQRLKKMHGLAGLTPYFF